MMDARVNCTVIGIVVFGKIEIFNSFIVVGIQGNCTLTPRRYAISNRCVLTPTCIFVFMLLISPGIVGGTETIIATAARQFFKRHKGCAGSTFEKKKTYNPIRIPVPSMRLIHRGNVDMCAVYEPILSNERGHKLRSSLRMTRNANLRRLS